MRWFVDIRWWYHISWQHFILTVTKKLHLLPYNLHHSLYVYIVSVVYALFSIQFNLIAFCMRMSLNENYFSFACQLRKYACAMCTSLHNISLIVYQKNRGAEKSNMREAANYDMRFTLNGFLQRFILTFSKIFGIHNARRTSWTELKNEIEGKREKERDWEGVRERAKKECFNKLSAKNGQ